MKQKQRIAFLSEIRSMDKEALRNKIKEQRLKLNKLKATHSVSPLENPSLLAATRRDIARMHTVLREMEQTPAPTENQTLSSLT